MTVIPLPEEKPTLPAWPTLGEVFGMGRSAVYELARRAANGDETALPVKVYRIGRGYRVSTASLRAVLGLDSGNTNAALAGAAFEGSVPQSRS